MLGRFAVRTGVPVVVVGFGEAREKSGGFFRIGGLGERHVDWRRLLIGHINNYGKPGRVAFHLRGDLVLARSEPRD